MEGGSLGWERAKVSNRLCLEEQGSLQTHRVLKERLELQSVLGRSSPRKGFYHTSLQAWGPPFLRLG